MLCLLSFIMLCFCFLKICIIIQWYVRSVFWKKWRSVLFFTWICEYILEKSLSTSEVWPILALTAPSSLFQIDCILKWWVMYCTVYCNLDHFPALFRDCCLTLSDQFFSYMYVMTRTCYISIFTRPTCLVGFL
jgi:hypothetical protein